MMNAETTKIMESGDSLREWMMNLTHPGTNDNQYYEVEQGFMYSNYGYNAIYREPDWDQVREDILSHYEWVETVDDLEEALSDNISAYRIHSWG